MNNAYPGMSSWHKSGARGAVFQKYANAHLNAQISFGTSFEKRERVKKDYARFHHGDSLKDWSPSPSARGHRIRKLLSTQATLAAPYGIQAHTHTATH